MKGTRIAWAITLCLVMAVVLWACGGGGGGGTTPGTTYNNATLSGTYSGALISNSVAAEIQSGFYNAVFDGVSSITYGGTFSNTGSGANQSESGSGTYIVNSDGTFTTLDLISRSTNPQGDLIISTNVSDAARGQELSVIAKRGTGSYTTASLNGVYNYVALVHDTGTYKSAFGTVTFNGSGACNMSGITAMLGVTGSASVSDTCTYAITPDGTVYFIVNSGPSWFKGTINSKGDFIPLATYDDVNDQQVLYLLKSGVSGYSNASLNGNYYFGYLSFMFGETKSEYGTLAFNGAGAFTRAGVYYSNIAGVNNPDSAVATYTVNSDGTFSFLGGNMSGVISPDGKTLMAAHIGSLSEVGILIGMQK